jgi:hypothetical protein
MRGILCAQSERNRSGLSIVEIVVVVEWWPRGRDGRFSVLRSVRSSPL